MKEFFLKQNEYENWANNKLIQAFLSAAGPSERASAVLCHILSVKEFWLAKITGSADITSVWNVLPSDQLLTKQQELYETMRDYLAKADPEALAQSVAMQTPRGPLYYTVTEVLTQLALHAAYHRGQVIVHLKPHLAYIPKLDYLVFAAEEKRKNGK